MSVKVKCGVCQKVLSVPDTARGKAVKCPACENRIPVPAGEAAPAKKAKAKPSEDPDDFLASLDLRNAEDRKARICPKCGCDLKNLEEDETECPDCGFDTSTGGLGAAAQKRALKGPDPDKFFKGLWADGWAFVKRNQMLAWRSIMYTLVASLLAAISAFMFLYNSTWPPRVFFGLVTTVCLMVIPGWYWYADVFIIQAAMEKKDKIKRLNFDFFMASALGIKFVVWNIFFAGPIVAIPALIGWFLVRGGSPEYVMGILIGVAYIPVLLMFPGVMGHMSMPISTKGWMFWKVLPTLGETFKGSFMWLSLAIVTNLFTIGTLGAMAALYAPQVIGVANAMEANADVYRRKAAAEAKPKTLKKGEAPPPPAAPIPDPVAVDYKPLIIPAILWTVAFIPFGFTALFNMRTNGLFVYYFRPALGLVGQAKAYKYKATLARGDEDDEYKPKTNQQAIIEAVMVCAILGLLGGIFGMLGGALFNAGGISTGVFVALGIIIGGNLTIMAGALMVSKEAVDHGNPIYGVAGSFISFWWIIRIVQRLFADILLIAVGIDLLLLTSLIVLMIYSAKHWSEAKVGCLTAILGAMMMFATILVLFFALDVPGFVKELVGMDEPAAAQVAPDPGEMPDGMMPAMPPGAPGGPAMPAAPAGAPGMP